MAKRKIKKRLADLIRKKKVNPEERFNIETILLEHRQVFLSDIIDDVSAKKVVEQLLALDLISSKQPIMLRINSGGGGIFAGMSIINTMRTLKSPVITFVSGAACSMAALIFVCGVKRIMSTNTVWMCHPTAGGIGHDYFPFVKDRVKGLELYQKIKEEILKKNTKLTAGEIEKIQNGGEIWLTAEECLQKGITDYVV